MSNLLLIVLLYTTEPDPFDYECPAEHENFAHGLSADPPGTVYQKPQKVGNTRETEGVYNPPKDIYSTPEDVYKPPEKFTNYTCHAMFSINTGRAGSTFMAFAWAHYKNLNARHEDINSFPLGLNIDVFQHGFESSYDKRKATKLAQMNPILGRGEIFGETSLIFIKAFADVVVKELVEAQGCRVDVVILRRYLPKVIGSLLRNDFDTGSKLGYWYGAPNAITLLDPPVVPDAEVNRAIYYAIDSEMQALHFIEMYKDHPLIHIHEYRTEILATPTGMEKMAEDLSITLKDNVNIIDIICTVVNPKKTNHQAYPDEEMEAALQTYISTAKAQHVFLPELPQMQAVEPDFHCDHMETKPANNNILGLGHV